MPIVDTLSFEGNRPHANGVSVTVGNGEARSVRARREVLLCAGAIHSPAVLQRSGIGPRAWLEPLGIKVVADRPVGQHLLDHPILSSLLDLKRRTRRPAPWRTATPTAASATARASRAPASTT